MLIGTGSSIGKAIFIRQALVNKWRDDPDSKFLYKAISKKLFKIEDPLFWIKNENTPLEEIAAELLSC